MADSLFEKFTDPEGPSMHQTFALKGLGHQTWRNIGVFIVMDSSHLLGAVSSETDVLVTVIQV